MRFFFVLSFLFVGISDARLGQRGRRGARRPQGHWVVKQKPSEASPPARRAKQKPSEQAEPETRVPYNSATPEQGKMEVFQKTYEQHSTPDEHVLFLDENVALERVQEEPGYGAAVAACHHPKQQRQGRDRRRRCRRQQEHVPAPIPVCNHSEKQEQTRPCSQKSPGDQLGLAEIMAALIRNNIRDPGCAGHHFCASRELQWDTSRPFGPLGNVSASFEANKKISFPLAWTGRLTGGYEYAVQCTGFAHNARRHIFSFLLEGMVNDYGYNAIALTLQPEDLGDRPRASFLTML